MFSTLRRIAVKCKEVITKPKNQAIGAVMVTSVAFIYTMFRQLLSLENSALSSESNSALTLLPAESASALAVIENVQSTLVSAATLLLPIGGQLPDFFNQLLLTDTGISCALTRTFGLSLAIMNQGTLRAPTLALLLGEMACLPIVSATTKTPFPATLRLAHLTAHTGFNITGVARNDWSGRSVSSAGDVNGDGMNDLIIGAPLANGDTGASYVVFGANNIGSTGTLSLAALNGGNGFKIPGVTAGDRSGSSVSSAGDVNGDGMNDLIIGAPFANNFTGVSYVVFGATGIGSTGTLSLAALNGGNGFKIPGVTAGDRSGSSVSSAGDVNGDGMNDLIIGAPDANRLAGASYVVFGATGIGSTGTLSLAALNGGNGFNITGVAGGESGSSVSSAGDVNGDGMNDLIIGAPYANSHAGVSYVVFGANNIGSTGTLSLAALNGGNGFNITGVTVFDRSGSSVSSAGDVNGDGMNDLIIGASNANISTGVSYVVFGANNIGSTGTLSLAALNGGNGFKITGVTEGDWSGYSVSSAGDVNGDRMNDLIIGAPIANSFTGASYVVFGANNIGSTGTLSLAALNGGNGFKITGVAASESGSSVSSAGDVNGDGMNDLIIGAPGTLSPRPGVSHVVFGNRLSRTITPTPSVSQSPLGSTPSSTTTHTFLNTESLSGSRSLSLPVSHSASNRISNTKGLSGSKSLSLPVSHSASNQLSNTRSLSGSGSKRLSLFVSHSLTPRRAQTHTLRAHAKTSSKTMVDSNSTAQPLRYPFEGGISPEAAKAIADSATGLTVIAGAIFSPALANKALAISRITSLAQQCAYVENDYDLNAIQFAPLFSASLGTSDSNAATINGAIISTTSLMALALGMFLCTGYLRSNHRHLNRAHNTLATIFATVMSYYGPNVTEVATVSAGHFSAGDKALALGAMACWTAVFMGIGHRVYQQSTEDAVSRFSVSSFYEPARDFSRHPIRLLVLIDMAVAYSFALLSGIRPGTKACQYVAIMMILLSSGYLGYLLRLRPYSSTMEQALVTINALLQLALSAMSLATIYNNSSHPTLEAVKHAAFCFLYLQTAIVTLRSVREWYKNRKKIPQEDTIDEHLAFPFVQQTHTPLIPDETGADIPHAENALQPELTVPQIVTNIEPTAEQEGATLMNNANDPDPDWVESLLAGPPRSPLLVTANPIIAFTAAETHQRGVGFFEKNSSSQRKIPEDTPNFDRNHFDRSLL